MHILRLKGGTLAGTINYQFTSIYPAICTPWAALHPLEKFFDLIGTPRGSFAEDLTAYNPIAMIIQFKAIIFCQNYK